jgi:branched-chain amino acid aminotransferase
MLRSAKRMHLPEFDPQELNLCLRKLIEIDMEWVPSSDNYASLYIRPTMIGTEPTLGVASSKQCLLYVILSPVGGYFGNKIKPVSLMADPSYVRAWPGGCGDNKLGSNYAPTIAVQKKSEKDGFQQVLWLYGNDHQITEVGTMNIFVHLINEKGERELVTPPLDQGIILPGVTRASLLDLAREWNEFKVSERIITMKEVNKALAEKRLLEFFGAGTACVVCPVGRINYMGQDLIIPEMDPKHGQSLFSRFLKTLTDIQYGTGPHPWAPLVN